MLQNMLSSKSLVEIFDDLQSNAKILFEEGRRDTELISHMVEVVEGSRVQEAQRSEECSDQLDEANKRIRQLEQKIRTLTIQLEEEKGINVDLEIENIKLRKQITHLKVTLESVNNNCYDDSLMDSKLETSLDSEANSTIVACPNVLSGQDLSSFPLLSDQSLMKGSFLAPKTPTTPMSAFPLLSDQTMMDSLLSQRSPIPASPFLFPKSLLKRSKRASDVSSPKSGKVTFSTDTYTKANPKVKISSETFVKKSRRRSKSVDFEAGDKTVIAPQVRHRFFFA